jgi:RNA polymerase sigma-70 factor (ECF subfamily)
VGSADESDEATGAARAHAPTQGATRRRRPVTAERLAQDLRDRQLVRRLKKRDDRAFHELVALYQHRIFGLVLRMIGNRQEAEDLAQEVFVTVYRAIDGYRGEGRFYTWLYRIATNTCRNRIKYLKGRQFHRSVRVEDTPEAHVQVQATGPVVSLQSHVPSPEAMVEGTRLEHAISREIAELEPEHRVLIVLRDIEGLSYQDIVRVTGLPEGTLKSRLHRARMALKVRLTPYLR